MSTTAVIVEILIIGMQGAIWIILIALSILGYDWIRLAMVSIKGWEPLFSAFFIGVCYTLGTFIDRMADCLFILYNPGETIMRFNWIKHISEVAHGDVRMDVLRRESRTNEFLSNIRSRVRIARATVLNVFLITVSTVVFLYAHTEYTSWEIIVSISAVGFFLTFISLLFFGILEVTYKRRLDQATIANEDKNQNPGEGQITSSSPDAESV